MKKLTFPILLLFACNYIFAQKPDTAKINNDSTLKKIFSYMPEGWDITINDSEFIFVRKDSIWVLDEDRFNPTIANETKSEKTERIIRQGNRTISRIILKYEDRWSDNKILVAKNMNPLLYKQISALPEKYNITGLYNKNLSTRGNAVYTAVTKKDKDQVAKFEKERKELLAKIVRLPNYNTDKYSFFIKSMVGYNDNTHQVYPDDASSQLYKIISLFSEFGGQ
jgi:hypothetical protein